MGKGRGKRKIVQESDNGQATQASTVWKSRTTGGKRVMFKKEGGNIHDLCKD